MSVKEVVFKFIEEHPDMPLDQIVKGLSELNKASVRKYYYDYRKLAQSGKPEEAKDSGKGASKGDSQSSDKAEEKKETISIRSKVYEMLDANPQISIDQLCGAIEGSSRKTIRDYRNRWRRENDLPGENEAASTEKPDTEDDGRKAVYSFMQENPDANLNDLRQKFPENQKLVTDFRSWKHQQAIKLKETGKALEESVASHLTVESYKKTIDSMKEVIEKQKGIIESQRVKLQQVRSQLASTPKFSLDGLKSFLKDKLRNR